jgi:hypothetical protein
MKGEDPFYELIHRIEINKDVPEKNICTLWEYVRVYVQNYSQLFELDITNSPLKYDSLLFKSFYAGDIDPLKLPLQHRYFFCVMQNIKLDNSKGWIAFKKFIHILCYHLVIYSENPSRKLLNWIKWIITFSDNFKKYRHKYLYDEKWQPFDLCRIISHIYNNLEYIIENGEDEIGAKLYSEMEYIANSFRDKYNFGYIPCGKKVRETNLLIIVDLISVVDFISIFGLPLNVYVEKFQKLKQSFKKWLLARQTNT